MGVEWVEVGMYRVSVAVKWSVVDCRKIQIHLHLVNRVFISFTFTGVAARARYSAGSHG